MKSLNIVIIGQWIYPILTPRSHRTWNLATCLANMGHRVTVYALLGETNYSKLEVEHGITIKNLGKSKYGCVDSDGGSVNVLKRLLKKVLEKRYQFPHIELVKLVRNAVDSFEEEVDLLISIAHPHTIHWGVAEAFPNDKVKCWIADCGDPFMLDPFHSHPQKFEKRERDWCEKVDAILVPLEKAKEGYYKEYRQKIHVVPQGFDFSKIRIAEYNQNPVPTFAFAGQVYPGIRDPKRLLQFLAKLEKNFKFVIYTNLRRHFEPYASLIGEKVEFRNYVPREDLIYELSKMDFLVNVENIGQVQQPSKLIDYAQAQRPVISISSNFHNTEQANFLNFLRGNYKQCCKTPDPQQFEINNICQKIIGIMYNLPLK